MSGMICASGQEERKNEAWEWPLKIVNGFSSNFGEYRSNHFHVGLDLRTFQKNGYPVYAVSDGIVEVIRKDWQGTGLGVVIRHDNGYRTFTYHLDALREDLQKILDDYIHRFGDYYPGNIELKKIIRLKKGENYAYSGESGSGFPHLHIEIRNTQGKAVNPFFMLNSPMEDKRSPRMQSLIVRARDTTLINHETREWEGRLNPDQSGIYTLGTPLTIDGPSDWIIVGEDISDTGRPVAPYRIRFTLDKDVLVNIEFNELTRQQNPQVGLVYDRQYSAMGHYAYTLYAQPGNTLYGTQTERFEAVWSNMRSGFHEALVEMEDVAGNAASTRISFYYLPFQAIKIKLISLDERLFEMSGDPSVLPAKLVVRTYDSNNKPLFTGDLHIDSMVSSQKFKLDELSGQTATIEFHLMKNGQRIWYDRLAVKEQSPENGFVKPDWLINRDSVSLSYPIGQKNPSILNCNGKPFHLSAVREALQAVFHIYSAKDITVEAIKEEREQTDRESLLLLTPDSECRWAGKGYTLVAGTGSVNMNRLLKIDSEADADNTEYPVCSQPIALSPTHLYLMKPIDVSLTVQPQDNSEELGLFVCSERGGRWRYLATKDCGNGLFTSRLSVLGVKMALMRDIFPPRIMKGRLDVSRKKRFLIGVYDKGKGIDYRSVSVRCGKQDLFAEYDPDRSRLDVSLDSLRPGRHTLRVQIRDYAGHESSRQFTVSVK